MSNYNDVYEVDGSVLLDGTELDSRVTDLEGSSTLPTYLQSEANTVLSSVIDVCEDKAYLFMVITDSHNERNDIARMAWDDAMTAMQWLYKNYRSDAVVHLGDIIHGVVDAPTAKARIRESVNNMLNICPKVFLCRGNHESDFAYDADHYELISTDEIYSLTARQNEEYVVRPENKLYYYVDYGEDLRCVFLDSDMIKYGSGQTTADLRQNKDGERYGYDAQQITWFSDVALDTDRQVAVFSHMPATRSYMTASSYWTSENTESFDNIRAVAKSFIDNGGTIVGWFFGHIHNKSKNKNSSAGFTEIGLRNSFYTEESTGGVHNIPNFSVIAIKPDKRAVNVIAFGQDSDDSFTY